MWSGYHDRWWSHYWLCGADLQSCDHTLVMTCGMNKKTPKEAPLVSPPVSDCLRLDPGPFGVGQSKVIQYSIRSPNLKQIAILLQYVWSQWIIRRLWHSQISYPGCKRHKLIADCECQHSAPHEFLMVTLMAVCSSCISVQCNRGVIFYYYQNPYEEEIL